MNADEFPIVLFSTAHGDVRVNAVLRDRTQSTYCNKWIGNAGVWDV